MKLVTKIKNMMLKRQKDEVRILNSDEAIDALLDSKKSLVRFGDGELFLILGVQIGFQSSNSELGKRLEEVLRSNNENILIGIPDVINYSAYEELNEKSKEYWINNMYKYRKIWISNLDSKHTYVTANLTRFYVRKKDKSDCKELVDKIRLLWDKKEVVIIEGEKTRFGIGNDLLDNAKTVTRVICPAENAFDKYEDILEYSKNLNKDALLLVSLGPTATVLAYDLGLEGYQAIDVGHLDLEYEWYLRQVDEVVKIENKYTNEVVDGSEVEIVDDSSYKEQIIKVIS